MRRDQEINSFLSRPTPCERLVLPCVKQFMCETHFLGSNSPLIPKAVDFLFRKVGIDLKKRREYDGPADMSGLVCVLPSTFGVTLLRRRLAEKAKSLGVELIPPEVITSGGLARKLVGPTASKRSKGDQPASDKALGRSDRFRADTGLGSRVDANTCRTIASVDSESAGIGFRQPVVGICIDDSAFAHGHGDQLVSLS